MGEDVEGRWRVTWKEHGSGFVSWRPGYALPQRWHATLEGENSPYRVELDFTADQHGPECKAVQFVVRDEPISASRLRHVPVGECIEVAITAAAMRVEQRPGEIAVTLPARRVLAAESPRSQLTERGDVDVTERAQFASQVSARHEHGTDEHLQRVSEIYLAASKKPTQAVEDAFGPHVSHSTAARWVMQARRKGFLPPTTRGRASARKGQ